MTGILTNEMKKTQRGLARTGVEDEMLKTVVCDISKGDIEKLGDEGELSDLDFICQKNGFGGLQC